MHVRSYCTLITYILYLHLLYYPGYVLDRAVSFWGSCPSYNNSITIGSVMHRSHPHLVRRHSDGGGVGVTLWMISPRWSRSAGLLVSRMNVMNGDAPHWSSRTAYACQHILYVSVCASANVGERPRSVTVNNTSFLKLYWSVWGNPQSARSVLTGSAASRDSLCSWRKKPQLGTSLNKTIQKTW